MPKNDGVKMNCMKNPHNKDQILARKIDILPKHCESTEGN